MSVIGGFYEGGGAKPVSWHKIGVTVEGQIVGIRSKQLTKFGTEVPETWPNGEPKLTPVVTVQTDEQDDPEDDGRRDVYLRNNLHTAFGKALREAYKSKPGDDDLIGATLKMQFYKTEPSGKGQPRKLFRARITPRQSASSAWDDSERQPGDESEADIF